MINIPLIQTRYILDGTALQSESAETKIMIDELKTRAEKQVIDGAVSEFFKQFLVSEERIFVGYAGEFIYFSTRSEAEHFCRLRNLEFHNICKEFNLSLDLMRVKEVMQNAINDE